LKFRVFEIYANLCQVSVELFNRCDGSGWIGRILDTTVSDDFLQQLNALELLDMILQKDYGVAYLVASGYLDTIKSFLKSGDDLLEGKAIEILGNVIERGKGEVFEKFIDLIHVVSKIIERNPSDKLITFFYQIMVSKNGLKFISESKDILDFIIQPIDSTNNDLRISSLHCLSGLLAKYPSDDENREVLKNIYAEIPRVKNYSTTELLLSYLRKPIDDLRAASYSVFYALVRHSWGLELFMSAAGVSEYFLNRSEDDTALGLKWKYMILELIFKFENSKKIIGVDYYYLIKEYLELGMYYKKTESTVSIKNLHE